MIAADVYTSDKTSNPSAVALVGIVCRGGREGSAREADEGAGWDRTAMENNEAECPPSGPEAEASIEEEPARKYEEDVEKNDAEEEAPESAYDAAKSIRWNLPCGQPVPQRTARWPVVKRKTKMTYPIYASKIIESSIDEIFKGIEEVVKRIRGEGSVGRLAIVNAASHAYGSANSLIGVLDFNGIDEWKKTIKERLDSLDSQNQPPSVSSEKRRSSIVRRFAKMMDGKSAKDDNIAFAQELVNEMAKVYRGLKEVLRLLDNPMILPRSPGKESDSVDFGETGMHVPACHPAAALSPAAATKLINPDSLRAAACACKHVKEGTVCGMTLVTTTGDAAGIVCMICGALTICGSSVCEPTLTRIADSMEKEGNPYELCEVSDSSLKQSVLENMKICLSIKQSVCLDGTAGGSHSGLGACGVLKGADNKPPPAEHDS